MLNSFLNSNFSKNDVLSLLEGHHRFLEKNTGVTVDAKKDHYVLNEQGVLANNRHFIADNQMEAQPNGDATTEGQSVLIIGYAYAYMATGKQEYLDAATKYFDAYIDKFYAGQPIPDTPERYICNWIVNGKEPVVANWPVDFDAPTHSGFKGEMINFTDGRCLIPHGESDGGNGSGKAYWGEYLDKATFAFDGALGWDSIVATVYGLKADGVTTDWNSKGVQYDVDWVVNYTGKKIDWDGNVLEEVASEPKGTIQLKDTSVQGMHKMNWGNAQPVEHGGYMIQTNQAWHNRPLRVPVGVDPSTGEVNRFGQFGNAADGEEWFADAAYLMYEITGNTKYWRVWRSVMITLQEYSEVDATDKFFRKSTNADTPFTDGIGYDYVYPGEAQVKMIRDSEGYVDVSVDRGGSHTMEQQAVWFKVNADSKVRTEFSGRDETGGNLTATVVVKCARSKEEDESNWSQWQTILPYSGGTPTLNDIRMGDFTQVRAEDGTEFIMADSRIVVNYGDSQGYMQFEDQVVGSRSALVSRSTLTKSSDGVVIGFWLTSTKRAPINSIYYRSNTQMKLGLNDNDNWAWHWKLANTNNGWNNRPLNKAELVLDDYQPNEDGGKKPPRPTAPNFVDVDQIEVTMIDNIPNGEFSFYCVNTVPSNYNLGDRFIMMYSLTTRGAANFHYKLGDCTVIDYLPNNLYCTPGVIPFSNIYVEGAEQFDGWYGMPYPGYQYPFIWHEQGKEVQLNNMVEFLYQSQQWYKNKFGVMGPGASAYIWNRWDNYKYGKPDTWTMYHWGDGTAWSGYQPRAFFGAARCWYELEKKGLFVPPKLKAYVENWIVYLKEFMIESGGVSPTDFPMESIPKPNPDDFTGHMCALWLGGACMAAMAGSKMGGTSYLINMLVEEIRRNYKVTDVPDHVMNGSWTPALRLNTGSGPESNGMFFGFWAGEIMRALGIYLLYLESGAGDEGPLDMGDIYFPKVGERQFLPRFWTIDSQPTESCSVISSGNTLTARMINRTVAGLSGILWDSEDKFDHTGVSYETITNYAGRMLKFRMEIGGNQYTFNEPDHAPTLTVTNTLGTPSYVSLRHYTSDVSEDGRQATITIDFDNLYSGFFNDAKVSTSDIGQLMLTMSSKDYDESQVGVPLETNQELSLKITLMEPSKGWSRMEVFDAHIAAHDVGMATSYDDMYNLTPERVVENMWRLGYRGRVNHYCGMSHYYETQWNKANSKWELNQAVKINNSTREWHNSFMKELSSRGYSAHCSVSFELMSTVCPVEWVQHDWNDNLAATGYTPPSYVLSPTIDGGMDYITNVMIEFGQIMRNNGLTPGLQIGEPWWWYNVATGMPCVYDYPTKLAFNAATGLYAEDMGTLSNPKTSATIEKYKEFVRDRLGQRVVAIANRIRTALPGASVSPLPFLPSILGNSFMEEINLPTNYYTPNNFESYGTECYDWMLEGKMEKGKEAVTVPKDRMGWTDSRIYYLAGFVPNLTLAPIYGFSVNSPYQRELWKVIIGNMNHNAVDFPTMRQYIWAYPQVMEDSLTIYSADNKGFYLDGIRHVAYEFDSQIDLAPYKTK